MFAHRQQNHYCLLDKTLHSEIFYFDTVHGIENEYIGAKSRVFDLREQLDEWVEIVRGMEAVHEHIVAAYTPLLEAIKTAFMVHGKNVATWNARF